jgi:hypothetical protein
MILEVGVEEEIIVLAAASFCGFVVIGTFNLIEFQLFSSALLCAAGAMHIYRLSSLF